MPPAKRISDASGGSRSKKASSTAPSDKLPALPAGTAKLPQIAAFMEWWNFSWHWKANILRDGNLQLESFLFQEHCRE